MMSSEYRIRTCGKWILIVLGVYFLLNWVIGADAWWVGLLGLLGIGGGSRAHQVIKKKREELEKEMAEVIQYGKEKRAEEDRNIEKYKSKVDELGRVHQQLGITIGKKKEELEQQFQEEKKGIEEHDLSVGDALKTIREELRKNEK